MPNPTDKSKQQASNSSKLPINSNVGRPLPTPPKKPPNKLSIVSSTTSTTIASTTKSTSPDYLSGSPSTNSVLSKPRPFPRPPIMSKRVEVVSAPPRQTPVPAYVERLREAIRTEEDYVNKIKGFLKNVEDFKVLGGENYKLVKEIADVLKPLVQENILLSMAPSSIHSEKDVNEENLLEIFKSYRKNIDIFTKLVLSKQGHVSAEIDRLSVLMREHGEKLQKNFNVLPLKIQSLMKESAGTNVSLYLQNLCIAAAQRLTKYQLFFQQLLKEELLKARTAAENTLLDVLPRPISLSRTRIRYGI